MKPTTKNLYIIGLVLFLLGETISILKIIREALFFIPGAIRTEGNSVYITNSILAHVIPIIIKLIIAFIIVFMITRILKNIKSKCLIPLLYCSIVFFIINLTSFSLSAIPKYLIYAVLLFSEKYSSRDLHKLFVLVPLLSVFAVSVKYSTRFSVSKLL